MLRELQADLPQIGPQRASRVCSEYREHLQRATRDGTLVEAIAAMTVCNWNYVEVGRSLVSDIAGAIDGHPFDRWLQLYSDKTVDEVARQWLDLLERTAKDAEDGEKRAALKAFQTSLNFELAFWDDALSYQTTTQRNG
jgi:thiaminase